MGGLFVVVVVVVVVVVNLICWFVCERCVWFVFFGELLLLCLVLFYSYDLYFVKSYASVVDRPIIIHNNRIHISCKKRVHVNVFTMV